NDIYQPFIAKNRSKEHYVKAARISMLVLALIALIVTTQLTSIIDAYEYIGVIVIPVAVVLIARWYWWRVNVWSEISALLTAAIVGNCLAIWLPDSDGERWFAVRWLYTTIATLGVCLTVTLLTSRNGPTQQAVAFYNRLRIHGKGWQRVRELSGIEPVSVGIKDNSIACLASIVLIYSLLLCIGEALFEQWTHAGIYLLLALGSGIVVLKKMPLVIRKLREDVC
ncbi:MAG: hypothetical protein OIF34_14175, partial [Porticoccaceae bacterium]|nr:hypothetical protein [Porticoccaceae bacterium]